MKLEYKAVSRDGKNLKGIIEAKDIADAVVMLRSRGFLPTKITPQKPNEIIAMLPFLGKIHPSDVVFFTRQLASMLTSGLTLVQSLRILREQIQNLVFAEVVGNIISDIEEGKTFSEAIAKHPQAFSPIYISIVKASEVSGLMDIMLVRLADNLEKQQKLESTIRGALMYPAIVIAGMVVVVIIMMIFVIPTLNVLYENLNIPLPLPTQIIVGLSNFIINFWFIILGMIVLSIFLFRRWKKTESGELLFDDIVLKLPIFGKLIREMVLTEFTRTLGLLVGSGTLVVDAINQTADTSANLLYRNAIIGVAKRVEKGMSIGDAIASYNLFPPILVQMVRIGEETGKLDDSLIRVSEYFEREVDQTVKTLTTAMEPIIMIILGIGVAFLIISIITPIYTITTSLQ